MNILYTTNGEENMKNISHLHFVQHCCNMCFHSRVLVYQQWWTIVYTLPVLQYTRVHISSGL